MHTSPINLANTINIKSLRVCISNLSLALLQGKHIAGLVVICTICKIVHGKYCGNRLSKIQTSQCI